MGFLPADALICRHFYSYEAVRSYYRISTVVVVDFYFTSQGQTGNGAQFYGSEFQKGESYGGGGGGREMITILQRQQSDFAVSIERF